MPPITSKWMVGAFIPRVYPLCPNCGTGNLRATYLFNRGVDEQGEVVSERAPVGLSLNL